MTERSGRLVLAATPIGDTRDASLRLRELLAAADIVAAEDTRRLRRLTARLDVEVRGHVVSYHEHNEGSRTRYLADRMANGDTVLLVTDAGMPTVSDPGYRLVSAARSAGIPVTAVPGPSAVTTALAVSGLPVDRFCFEGFLPRKRGVRRQRLAALGDEVRTMVFFEAPHRLAEVLEDMAETWGADRVAAICRELTKTHEEVRRGGLGELASWAADGVRGEVTLVVAGSAATVEHSDRDLRAAVDAAESESASRKDAITAVAKRLGVPRRRVYEAAHDSDT